MMRYTSWLAAGARPLCMGALVLALALILGGCGDTATAPTAAVPSPTIAAPPRRSPTLGAAGSAATRAPAAAQPTATPPIFASPTAAPPAGTPTKLEPFVYLWPAYLPDGMQVSPSE